VTVGTIVDQRPSACSATSDPAGQATTTWQPRRTASATWPAVARSAPSGASTTTRSRPPAQPGRAGPGQATNGTGHHGSRTARSRGESGAAAPIAPGGRARRAGAGGGARGGGVRGGGGLARARDAVGGLDRLTADPGASLGQLPQP